jgi:3-oxoacyl-[acyl-carrier-protein] synthase-1
MSDSSRILITGSGAVCGAGLGVASIWDAVVNGRSAVGPLRQWDASRWPAGIAAEVTRVENRQLVEDRKLHKIISRTDLFGLYAAGAAILDSRLTMYRDALLDAAGAARFDDRSGVFAGSGGAAYRSNYDFFPLLTTAGGDLQTFGRELTATVNPMWLLKNLPNNVVCHIGIRHYFKGTNACITNQCVGGVLAIAEAAAAIRAGEADRAVAVGHDAPIEPETLLHYHNLGLLSREAVRPFDRDRDGTVFGEGAAAVVLEKQSDAAARQAPMAGEFLGAGCVTEASGVVEVRPDGDGLARAMHLALADARLSPDAVGMIVAHGNGTRASDASEAAAIRRVFGESPPPITAFKWAYGHLIAASGALDVLLALQCLRHRIVPGIATLNSLDPALGPLPVSRSSQRPRSDTAMVCCRGFGGMNVALLVGGGQSMVSCDQAIPLTDPN